VKPNHAQLALLRRAVANGEARTLDPNERLTARVLARLDLATVTPVGTRTLRVVPTEAGAALIRDADARPAVAPCDRLYPDFGDHITFERVGGELRVARDEST
jgi:hypothetical protein